MYSALCWYFHTALPAANVRFPPKSTIGHVPLPPPTM
jgi:hypothetical protein